jgi:DNA-binding NarL/FixJ family response regulator
MITDKLRKIATMRAKLAALEKSTAVERARELAALPGRYGFQNVRAFIKAVRAAASGKSRRGRSLVRPTGEKKKHKRATITDQTRAAVKKMTEEGKTGKEIAKAVRISLPSVQNVKAALGLVKKRK